MRKTFRGVIFILLFQLSDIYSFSQQPSSQSGGNYWQQKVDYKIEVSLDDTRNELTAFITIDYTNNSPQTLNFIYFHLWPNAYLDQSTPFAKQMVENGKTTFWYSKEEQRGYIDKLDFKLDAQVCKWQYDSLTRDICKILLNKPLEPGGHIQISTPFHVKIPETFSRLGHIGQSYQITQWYPKPAVYDKYGWHPLHYLDQGEFYSEFGSFDVSITLPANYVVGATGDLQDTSEISWMNAKAEATQTAMHNWNLNTDVSFPPSSKELKTIRFKQTNIHDFGWFADKRFNVLKGEVELPYSKNKVTTWSLFTNYEPKLWNRAPEYLHDAIYYYSLWLGDYPYKQVTAVDGTISAGGGMEYPNVTIIGEEKNAFSLDEVITHEVGHNWFYGMLGSNERDHAWMDEGMNSFYEYRYIAQKYPDHRVIGNLPYGLAKFLDVAQYKEKYLLDFAYQLMARENMDQPIELTSAKFTDFNYGVIVYGKSTLIFDYFESYLGTPAFDKVMKKYFESWKYKHPQPEDLKKLFESETGKNLNWFFDDLLKTDKKIDYKITKVTKSAVPAGQMGITWNVELKNIGAVNSPVCIAQMAKDSVISMQWVDGFAGTETITIPNAGADKIQIDPLLEIPEINRRNNSWKFSKPAHKFQRLRFQFIGSVENQNRTQVFFAPYLAWNNYDKTQLGIAIYSSFAPKRKFEYLLVPAFGTGSKQFIGTARLNYNFFPKKVQRFTMGVKEKRFSYLLFPKDLTYTKLEPYFNISLKKKDMRSPFDQYLNFRSVQIWEQWINPSLVDASGNEILNRSSQYYYINEARYRLERNSTLHPFDVNLTLQQGSQFAALWAEAHFKISYKQKNQGLFVRLFAGGFPVYHKNSSDISAPLPNMYLSNVSNYNYAYWLQKDYTFDENFVDRNGVDRYLGRQVAFTGGGFRSITNVGATNKALAAANFSSSIYRYIPIRPFASISGFIDDNRKLNFAAEFGLSLVIVKDMIEIHLPLATTKNISDEQNINNLGKWYQKFTYTLDIKLGKPIKLLRQFAGV